MKKNTTKTKGVLFNMKMVEERKQLLAGAADRVGTTQTRLVEGGINILLGIPDPAAESWVKILKIWVPKTSPGLQPTGNELMLA